VSLDGGLRLRAGAAVQFADAQFVIVRSHGFENWPKFAKHLEALSRCATDVTLLDLFVTSPTILVLPFVHEVE
jgi:hypothetical protein